MKRSVSDLGAIGFALAGFATLSIAAGFAPVVSPTPPLGAGFATPPIATDAMLAVSATPPIGDALVISATRARRATYRTPPRHAT
jgi:hypothetical protein